MTENASSTNSTGSGNDDLAAVRARFDVDVVPEGRASRRGLLIEVTAPETRTPAPRKSRRRPDLNLALVIDRSGSMALGRLEAAISAAQGIVDTLGARDRLSLVSFDDQVETHFEALAVDAAGRERAQRDIWALRPGAATDLGAGWHAGARCAAIAIAEETHRTGHVLVLSDGHANHGITDPDTLARHAGELALRDVKTSAVGIGDGYSPLQLDALAEAGQGRLHDAETAEDIVDVVMGELDELRETVVESPRLSLRYPAELEAKVLTRARTEQILNVIEIPLGDLRSGRTRRVVLMFDLPQLSAGQLLEFTAMLQWKHALTGEFHEQAITVPTLRVVHPQAADSAARDLDVVSAVANLWEASMAYQAASLNEAGDWQSAELVLAEADAAYGLWVRDLDDAEPRRRRMIRTRTAASGSWVGRKKREAFSLAKKQMRDEPDHRRRNTGSWDDHVGR